MKISKDKRKELDQEYVETSYMARKILKWVVITLIALSLLSGIGYAVNKIFMTKVDYVNFKSSQQYNEGVLTDLSKYRLEMMQTEDLVEKAAIQDVVIQQFANYDDSTIKADYLKVFITDCRNGVYSVDAN